MRSLLRPTVRAAALALVAGALALASEPSTSDWAKVLQPAPERTLLRQVVIEHRADDWLIAHATEVLAAIRSGTVDSSVAISVSEVLLERAALTYEDALDLHALLFRLHHPVDRTLAGNVLHQWLSWLPPEADLDQVQRRMAERGWTYTLANLLSLTRSRRNEWARLKASGQPLPTERRVEIGSGSIYGQHIWTSNVLSVQAP